MLVQVTPELEELIGIILGDGHLFSYPKIRQYGISITTNLLTDSAHLLNRVVPLMKMVWKIPPKIIILRKQTAIRCRIYSYEILSSLLNFQPLTLWKTKNCSIPKFILDNTTSSINCLRGIFDTDGSIFPKYGNYAQIGVRSYSKYLKKNIISILKKLDFNPSIDVNQNYIFIHRQNEIIKFFKLIGSSNPKHIVRYKIWRNEGKVPKVSSIVQKINSYSGDFPYFDKSNKSY